MVNGRARIYAISNQKGGVGKTTTAVNLAACLAAQGYRVLVVDADPQGNAGSSLGFDKSALSTTLYDALLGEAPTAEVIRPTHLPNLDLLPSTNVLAGAEIELVDLPERETTCAAPLPPLRARTRSSSSTARPASASLRSMPSPPPRG